MNFDALKQQLKEDEGLRLRPYGDLKGKITIGYGHNLTDIGISIEMAEQLLEDDIDLTVQTLRLRWAPFDRLDDVRQGVLANMAFNLGVGGLMLFTKMLAACASGEYLTAAAEMLDSTWAAQVGPRAHRLAKMMETGCA